MKPHRLLLAVMLLAILPSLSHAQVYKWKDKDGSVRYTDTPPPSNIKQETLGVQKTVQPTGKEPLSPVEEAKSGAGKKPPMELKGTKNAPPAKGEDADKIRQNNAEIEKNNKQEKEAEAQRKADNCKAAKANFETYNQGGRIYKMNEKGERIYLGDNDLKIGKEQAQKEIDRNCN